MNKWVYILTPQKISPLEYEEIRNKAISFAKTRSWSSLFDLKLRFRGEFCYIDYVRKNEQEVSKLCRLRCYGDNDWDVGFYVHSRNFYQPCYFPGEKDRGTIEQAIEIFELYLY